MQMSSLLYLTLHFHKLNLMCHFNPPLCPKSVEVLLEERLENLTYPFDSIGCNAPMCELIGSARTALE